MKVELIDVSECKKNLDIEIPQEVVEEEAMRIAREFGRKARVPGFRPGKAPVSVVKNVFRDEIATEMMQHLLPKSFTEAAQGRNLDIVGTPQFEKVDYASGKPLRFKAVFGVYPQFEVTNYSGIPAEEISSVVEESEVEAALKRFQEDMAELTPVEERRATKEGDFAEISFNGTVPDSDDPPVTAEKTVCEIGGRATLKEFSENLVGVTPGEERTFPVTYKPGHPEKKLAGKTIEYKVKLDAIKEKKVPDLDDELAQGLGDYKTLDELRAKVRQDLEKHKKEQAEEQVREKLLEWLEDNNEFEVPESLVEHQLRIRVQRLVRDLARQGINPQRLDVDWGKIQEDQRKQAARDVKGSLILDHISGKEGIQITDEEVEAEIGRIAEETNRPKEKVREVLTKDTGLERLKGQIRNKRVLDFLQERAQLQPAPKSY